MSRNNNNNNNSNSNSSSSIPMDEDDEALRWKLKAVLEVFSKTADLMIEKKREYEAELEDPTRKHTLAESMKRTNEDLRQSASIVYTFILSYNRYKPLGEFKDLTDTDILKAQLIQDEVTAKLAAAGIILHYHSPQTQDNK